MQELHRPRMKCFPKPCNKLDDCKPSQIWTSLEAGHSVSHIHVASCLHLEPIQRHPHHRTNCRPAWRTAGFNSHRQRSTLAEPARHTQCPGSIRRRKFIMRCRRRNWPNKKEKFCSVPNVGQVRDSPRLASGQSLPATRVQHMRHQELVLAVGTHYGPTRIYGPTGHAIGGTAQQALQSFYRR